MHLFDKHQLFVPSLWVTPLYQMQCFKKQLLVMWIWGEGGNVNWKEPKFRLCTGVPWVRRERLFPRNHRPDDICRKCGGKGY